jgi:peptidoglycan/xylan/chitin deacetylase (PgdA/CDA1 family)
MKREIVRNDRIMLKKAGVKTELYRPPFGITNPNSAAAIRKTGKKSIGWNIRSFDTAISDEKKILNRILPKIKPGSVILLHDTSDKTYRILEEILLFLERENYRSVTVSKLFDFKK